ncbi:MAG: HAMP domain-containing histidine kinase [Idiomarina sp.]|nr:HAMP domain-containing histidine kinase [Idiomarina sp.]
MAKIRRTRWYQSLALRLLALFWFLLLAAAAAALYLALYYTRPMEPQSLAEDFERTLPPIFATTQGSGLLQPGRLLVGEYRIIARFDEGAEEHQFAPASNQAVIARVMRLFEQSQPQQIPAGTQMLAGPFVADQSLLVVGRPLTSDELAALAVAEDQDWFPNVIMLAVAFSGFGALILGVWFVRPLKQLRDVMREIASGEASPNLKRLPRRRDELGELARTMRATAIELANSRDAQRRLLSDVSHELRSPLARSQLAIDLLGNEVDRENPHYRQLEKDVSRLSLIIDSILWLSRLENGLDDPICEEIDISALLKEIDDDIVYAEPKWGARLRMPKPDAPFIDTDPVLVRLVLENLIRNAFQYGPDDGLVWVTLAPARVEGQFRIAVTVRDEGEGVEEEKLEQLFKPFFRGDPSRHHGAGVGLGLALCQRASRVLGAELIAQNHPEGGLAVSLLLPLQPEAE